MAAVITRSRRRALLALAVLSAEAVLLAMLYVPTVGILFSTRPPVATAEALWSGGALALLFTALMAGAHALLRAGSGTGGARMFAGALAIGGGAALLVWLTPLLPGLAPAGGASFGFWFFAALFALLLWWRAALERDLSRQGTATAFRLGAFAAVLLGVVAAYALAPGAAAAAHGPRQAMATLLLWLFFAAALSALLLSRLHDTTLLGARVAPAPGAAPNMQRLASDAPVFAAALPWARAASLLAPVAGVLVLAALAALLWSQRSFAWFFGLLSPVTRALGWLVSAAIAALFWALSPLVVWLDGLSSSMKTELPPIYEIDPTPIPGSTVDAADLALAGGDRPWLYIGLAILLLLLFYFVLRRTIAALRDRPEELPMPAVEWGPPEPPAPPPDLPTRASELTPTELLAATNVRNLYANVCRLAARRGAPRPLDVAPDSYLHTLRGLFPGADEALGRLTIAYMRVHYGDIPTDPVELETLRADWESIRARWE